MHRFAEGRRALNEQQSRNRQPDPHFRRHQPAARRQGGEHLGTAYRKQEIGEQRGVQKVSLAAEHRRQAIQPFCAVEREQNQQKYRRVRNPDLNDAERYIRTAGESFGNGQRGAVHDIFIPEQVIAGEKCREEHERRSLEEHARLFLFPFHDRGSRNSGYSRRARHDRIIPDRHPDTSSAFSSKDIKLPEQRPYLRRFCGTTKKIPRNNAVLSSFRYWEFRIKTDSGTNSPTRSAQERLPRGRARHKSGCLPQPCAR